MSEKPSAFPKPVFEKNDRTARWLIWIVSIIVFAGIALLSRVKLNFSTAFDPHIFATINAAINSVVAVLLIAAFIAVRSKHYQLHKKLMLVAILLSVLFLISYICHHLLTGDTRFGDIDHNGVLSIAEKNKAGSIRQIYYAILLTHIPLAGIILPFILFTAYRALSGDYMKHKKLARLTWPVWLYVAISGVVVYLMIRPYY